MIREIRIPYLAADGSSGLGSREVSLLDRLVLSARDNFWKNAPSPARRVYDLYGASHAASDALKGIAEDNVTVFLQIVRETMLAPKDTCLMFPDKDRGGSWDDFFADVNRSIVSKELLRKFPDIYQEDRSRFNDWDPTGPL